MICLLTESQLIYLENNTLFLNLSYLGGGYIPSPQRLGLC
ncbi:hypothetical protein XCR1_1600004 [Xenorhabdus cabanillasii JM26]|uniref:Uncharacterized protein n=1 Tax=Xenorhabdus cabanillasii JM26 TaxID=1427517 RepID=W1ITC9_9GAMM|nr:hypothetical protein XCR1_1600004 [Xenorhabdus cabanillasii JM26]